MKKFTTHSENETLDLGRKLGELLKSGDIICLSGDLGTGKTVFVKGIANGLGIEEFITSPTFTIVNEYDSAIPLYHFDVYRIANTDEMFEIGFDEYIENKGIVVIEWAETISDILPNDTIKVMINKSKDDINQREIKIFFDGEKYQEYEKRFGE